MNAAEIKSHALQWIDAWNQRDLKRLMDYYADDVTFYSPFVTERWSIVEGKLSGKQKVLDHFTKGFEQTAAMNFELVDILTGVDSFIMIYHTASGNLAANLVELNELGKVKIVRAFYPSPS